MSTVRDYFRDKYDKTGPAYLQGILRTIGKMPPEDEESIPEHREVEWEKDLGVIEK